jgi:RNA polymerase sigma-70 factor (ECF subfamily)
VAAASPAAFNPRVTDPLPAELELLLERHLPALRAFVRLRAGRVVAARESSSDLVQSVCRELLKGSERFEYQGEAAFKSWLYTAALRKIVEKDRYYRSQKRDAGREIPADGHGDEQDGSLLDCYATFATPSRDVAVREQLARVEQAFEQLNDEQREVVTLARIVGLPHAEIARQMGRTEEATRQLLRRAMIKLSEILTDE